MRVVAAALLLAACTPAAPAVTIHSTPPPTATSTTTTVVAVTTTTTPVRTTTTHASRSARRLITVIPSTGDPWAALRRCESGDDYTNRTNSRYRGAYQFSWSTWRSVGGTGDPADATPAEQDERAHLLYQQRGRQPWPVCGRALP